MLEIIKNERSKFSKNSKIWLLFCIYIFSINYLLSKNQFYSEDKVRMEILK